MDSRALLNHVVRCFFLDGEEFVAVQIASTETLSALLVVVVASYLSGLGGVLWAFVAANAGWARGARLAVGPSTTGVRPGGMTVGDLVVVAHGVRGRVRFRLRGWPAGHVLVALEDLLAKTRGVRHVRVNEAAASIVVEFDPALQDASHLLELPLDGEVASISLPARVDESIVLQASPEAIWSFLEDFEGLPSDEGMLAVREDGPGRWHVMIELLGQRFLVRVVRAEEEPGRRLVFLLEGALQGRCVFTVTPEGSGALVREQVTYTLSNGFLDRTLGQLVNPALRRMARGQLASLQTFVDRTDCPS